MTIFFWDGSFGGAPNPVFSFPVEKLPSCWFSQLLWFQGCWFSRLLWGWVKGERNRQVKISQNLLLLPRFRCFSWIHAPLVVANLWLIFRIVKMFIWNIFPMACCVFEGVDFQKSLLHHSGSVFPLWLFYFSWEVILYWDCWIVA